jgi:hypothetical protein
MRPTSPGSSDIYFQNIENIRAEEGHDKRTV